MKNSVKIAILKNKKKFIIGAIILLCLNIAFGVWISQEIRQSENKADTTTENSSVKVSKDRQIDKPDFKAILGDYSGVTIGTDKEEEFWDLSIMSEHGDDGEYLIITNSETGAPGFEGKIMFLHNEVIIVEINQDQFKSMPANWERDVDDQYAVMGCVRTDKGVELTCRETTILFKNK